MTKSNSGVQLAGAVAIAAIVMVVYLHAPVVPVAVGATVAAVVIYRRKSRE